MAADETTRSSAMRVTQPTLDVLRELLANRGSELHGWSICKSTGRSGPTVYKILERLEERSLASSRWEEAGHTAGKPPRRLYRLTEEGAVQARAMLDGPRPVSSYRKS
jgi:DNA-binding PadR family transcriptional regulator